MVDMEEHVVSMKKVQSKDLKSGRLIGKGPSSVVYETTLGGKKYARKDFLRVPNDIFEKEAAALVGLDHPNVVRTFCWAVDEGSCSLVVELMDDDLLNLMQTRMDSQQKNSQSSGSATQRSHVIDLNKFLEDRKSVTRETASESVVMPCNPFTMPEALQIMLQIAEGVNYLHDKGVAHGDLKPKNILVAWNETVSSSSLDENMAFKVADFGLFWSKMKSRTLVSRRARNLELTRWRAPELWELTGLRDDEHGSSTDSDWDPDSSGEGIGELTPNFTFKDMASADVYSFALLCSQILTGEDPYPKLSLKDLLRRIRPTCPAQLRALLENCWGEKSKRPSFEGIFAELKGIQASLTGSDAVVVYERSMTDFTRKDTFEQVPEHSAASGQAGGGPEISSARKSHQTRGPIDVPIGHEEHSIKDNRAYGSKGTLVLQQRRTNEEASGISSFRPILTMSVSSMKKETKGLSTPIKCYGGKLKRRSPKFKELHRFSSSDVRVMTENFSTKNIMRQEGRYTVYKGFLVDTGSMVAVYRLRKDIEGAVEAFNMEMEMVSRLHHEYVVALVGYCLGPDPILIYENPDNCSLFDHLHGTSAKGRTLDWRRRLHIALNAAQGLEYLHMECSPSIVHRNVKSRNILLTPEFDAKVSDFELAKYMSETEDTVRVMTHVMGTVGYLGPNSFTTHCVSPQSDVYKFGIVLLELITGSPAFDPSMFNSRRHPSIALWVRESLQDDDIDSILSPMVKASYPNMEAIRKVLEIAMQSVESNCVYRPTMVKIVQELRYASAIEEGSII